MEPLLATNERLGPFINLFAICEIADLFFQTSELFDKCIGPLLRAEPHRMKRVAQFLDGHAVDTHGADAALLKRFDECDSVAWPVVGSHVEIGGDNRPQVVAKGNVQGRAIVESPDADPQHIGRGFGGRIGQLIDYVWVQFSRWEDARAPGSDPQQPLDAPLVDAEKGIKDGSDKIPPRAWKLISVT